MHIRNFSPATAPKLNIKGNDGDKASKSAQEPKERVSFGDSRLGAGLFMTAAGFIPVIGAGTNAMGAWASAWADGDETNGTTKGFRPTVGLAGTLANLAGTVVGAYGLFSGNHTARVAGLSLLGVSGLAAATVVGATFAKERH